jgi:hypothetical protein
VSNTRIAETTPTNAKVCQKPQNRQILLKNGDAKPVLDLPNRRLVSFFADAEKSNWHEL